MSSIVLPSSLASSSSADSKSPTKHLQKSFVSRHALHASGYHAPFSDCIKESFLVSLFSLTPSFGLLGRPGTGLDFCAAFGVGKAFSPTPAFFTTGLSSNFLWTLGTVGRALSVFPDRGVLIVLNCDVDLVAAGSEPFTSIFGASLGGGAGDCEAFSTFASLEHHRKIEHQRK